ncbi:MAG: hypothetical protein RIT43_205 [Bacteroidota bacterium]
MAIYRFRVTFEDYDDVSRDIEIRSAQTFEDFHHAIHSAIGFDASKPASFYMSDDHWTKGNEISNRELKESEVEKVVTLRKSRLCDFIADPHQKIYYIFDPETQWSFRIELIKIIVQEEAGATYPRCIKSAGEAPKQFGNLIVGALPTPEDFDPELMDEMLEDDEDEPEDDSVDTLIAGVEDVSNMGELNTNEEEKEEDEDFESADEDMADEDSRDNDEY